uniref:SURP motif domain-containing protein n=1 Tax=Macrostomum lignano TaxID=282301 RepID=A0A1I8F4V9_9PLAT
MRKRHFASSAEGPPSRLAKRGSESGSRQQQPEDVPDIPGAAPEERLIYQQMVDSFSVDHRPGGGRSSGGGGAAAGRMWIKAGVVQPGAGEMQLADTRRRKDTVKRKTNLELFKEELKAMQEKREAAEADDEAGAAAGRAPTEKPIRAGPAAGGLAAAASAAESRQDTTNLFLGNLHPEVTERDLMDLFGPVRAPGQRQNHVAPPAPRFERSKKRNCGFDSERAVDRLRDRDLMGYQMPDWLGQVRPDSHLSHLRAADAAAAIDPVTAAGVRAGRSMPSPRNGWPGIIVQQREMPVTVPADRSLLSVINRMVEHVVREGRAIRVGSSASASRTILAYRFLFDYNSAEHVYYRWRLYSILHGDTGAQLAPGRFPHAAPGGGHPPINVFTAGMPSELIDESGLPPYAGAGHGRRSPSPGGGHRSNRQRRHGSPADSAAADDKDEPDQLASARRLGLTTKRQSIARPWCGGLHTPSPPWKLSTASRRPFTTETEVEPERRCPLFLAGSAAQLAVKLPPECLACSPPWRVPPSREASSAGQLGDPGLVRVGALPADYLMRLNNAFLGLLVPDQQQQQQLLESASAAGELEKDPSASRSARRPPPPTSTVSRSAGHRDGDPLDVDAAGVVGGGGFTRSKWAALDASGGSGSGAGLVSAYDSDGNSGESD